MINKAQSLHRTVDFLDQLRHVQMSALRQDRKYRLLICLHLLSNRLRTYQQSKVCSYGRIFGPMVENTGNGTAPGFVLEERLIDLLIDRLAQVRKNLVLHCLTRGNEYCGNR